MRYVALLRGINVGGANKVDMKELKAVFEAAGTTSVRTYINSGNVIFSAEVPDRQQLASALEKAVAERFGIEIGVLLRDAEEMRTLVDAIPADWTNDAAMKCDVVFLWPEFDQPSVLGELPFKPDVEDVLYVAGAVVRRVDREHAAKSGLVRIVGTPLYKRTTVRNCNTVRKLLQLLEE